MIERGYGDGNEGEISYKRLYIIGVHMLIVTIDRGSE